MIVGFVLSHVVLAGLGGYAGFTVGFPRIMEHYKQAQVAAGGWRLLSWYATHVELERRHGDDEKFRDALLKFDSALEQHRYSGHPPISETMYYTYRMLNNTRLSQLESATGDRQPAVGYWEQAVENCSMMKWDDCSPETLVEFAKHLD